MHNRPDGAGLLRIARETLLNELLEELPEDRRYAARMAANAMAIVAREFEAGDRDLRRELELLTALYGEQTVLESGRSPGERAAAMNRRFAKDIRAGVLDGACAQGVRAMLFEQVRARLRVSNPKYLEAAGLD